MQYNRVVDGQCRQSRRDRAPHPSVYSVRSRLLPEAGCRHFFIHRQPNSLWTARVASRASAAKAKRDPSIAAGSLKTSDRQTDLLGVGLLVLLLGRKRGNLDLDAQSLSSGLHGQRDTTTVEVDLHDLDLNLVVNDPVEEYSSITKGYVIRTIPEFGETLQEGDSVTLVVSKGEQPKPVTVLSFIGIDIEIVRQQVTQTGLVVGEVTQRASDEPYGTVIDQSINAETKVDAGTTINFVISEGPAMPDYGDDATTSGGEPQP